MKDFSQLLEKLLLANGRNKKISLIAEYCKIKKNPERGIVIGVLSGNLKIKNVKISLFKELIKKRIDKNLFNFSYDYVGDFAETVSLIWPENNDKASTPSIIEIIEKFESNKPKENLPILENYMDTFSTNERWALIKLVTRNFRIGVSSRLIRLALANFGNKKIDEIETIWNGLSPPYEELFNWLENKKEKPKINFLEMYHPLMLANPINYDELMKLNYKKFIAEWKWDGIRIQISANQDKIKIFSRNGDEISESFPEIESFFKKNSKSLVLDGELLVGNNFQPENFNILQKRLNRKKPDKTTIEMFPSFIKAYDILFFQNNDLRNEPLYKRKKILKKWIEISNIEIIDYSKEVNFKNWKNLKITKELGTNQLGYEGIMIKSKNSSYKSGRQKGFWYKWKRNPKYVDAILMYAKRGHGKRTSYYSDFTFGLFSVSNILPICKSYSGFSDEELKKINKWVKSNTINRFGPVLEVKKELVFEIAFDEIMTSNRHKSAISLRFPRVFRVRWDKPVNETLTLEEFKKSFNIYNE